MVTPEGQEIFFTSYGMPYTNKHNLPKEVVAAVMKDRYTTTGEEPSDYSCSNLVAPIQLTTIEGWVGKHSVLLRIFDVMKSFWSFLGSVAHQVLEDSWHESHGGVPEERLYMEILGKTISGKLDLYRDEVVTDYKTCKDYKMIKGDFSDWEKAANVYAELCRQNGRPVKKLEIVVMITNWAAGNVYKNNYPDAQIQILEMRLWSEKEAQSYINDRVQQLITAEAILDSEKTIAAQSDEEKSRDEILERATVRLFEQFPCQSKEMWEDLKDFAIFKKDDETRARATKTCDTLEEAETHIGQKGWHATHEIVKRMTDRTRCLEWCSCQPLCKQYKAYCGLNIDPDAPKPLF